MTALSLRQLRTRLRAACKAVEPWYDWGPTWVTRLDTDDEGPGRFIDLQWLGVSVSLHFARTPSRREGR